MGDRPPPPPVLLDIAPLLAAAAAALSTNDLLHGPVFSLHDVMTAVEIGDEKLDAGCCRGAAAADCDVVDAVATAPELTAHHALAVADGLIAAEAAWHAGGSLGTTVLPAVCMLRPDRYGEEREGRWAARQPRPLSLSILTLAPSHLHTRSVSSCLFLRAICASLRSCCEAVRDLVIRGGVSEVRRNEGREEAGAGACTPNLAHSPRPLSTHKQDEDFQAHPQEVPRSAEAEDAGTLMEAARAALAGPDPLAALGLVEGDADTTTLLPLLAAHLAFRTALLAGVQASVALDFEAATRDFQAAADALASLSAPRPPPFALPPTWPPPGFDPAAARAAVPPVPPRPDRAFASVQEGFGACEATASGLAAAAGLPAATLARGGGLRSALRALAAFTAGTHGALPRSVASLAMGLGVEPLAGGTVGSEGEGAEAAPPPPRPAGPAALSEAAVCGSLALPPPGALPTPSAATFVTQAALGLQGWGVACLLNPARARRRARRALEDWVHVHQHAAVAEADPAFMAWAASAWGWAWPWPTGEGEFAVLPALDSDEPAPGAAGHASPLSAWTEEAAARCGGFHLRAGFGLGLYAPHEHVAVLWYADYLARREAAAADALAVRWPVKKARRKEAAGKKGRGGGARVDPCGPPSTKTDPVAAAAAAADAGAATTRAILLQAAMRAAAGLAAAGLTPPAPHPFNGLSDAFRARFGCMASLTTPPPLGYVDYEAHVLTKLADAAAHPARAADFLRGGRDTFAWARAGLVSGGGGGQVGGLEPAEAAALARVAGVNAVALGLVEKDPAGWAVELECGGGGPGGWLCAVKVKRR